MIWLHGRGAPIGLAPRRESLGDVVLSIAPIGSFEGDLFAEEQRRIERAVVARRRQFATARFLARQAMLRLGEPPCAIAANPSGAPQWPRGLVGSLSHCPDLAVALLSRRRRSVGVDIEQTGKLPAKSFANLFTERERRAGLDEPRATAIFSAKEALFKAVHPLAGRQIDFLEAEVQLDLDNQCFTARYLGQHPDNRVMDAAVGVATWSGQRVLTIAAI